MHVERRSHYNAAYQGSNIGGMNYWLFRSLVFFFFLQNDLARGDLREYPNLTEAHMNPSPWEKMNVKIAAQTLSSTLGKILLEIPNKYCHSCVTFP